VGAVVAFAIHSPALLFGEDATKGKTYNFSLQREIKHGKTRYFGLKVEKVQTAPAMSVVSRQTGDVRSSTQMDGKRVNQALSEDHPCKKAEKIPSA
jgi:hypothetical protein